MKHSLRLLAVLLCCLFAFSCNEKEQPHMPREKMAKVMTDLHLAEVYCTMVNDSTHTTTNKNQDSLAVYYKAILAHHHISFNELKSSMQWYASNSSQLDTVYIDVQNTMSTIEGVINAGGEEK